MLAHLSLPWWLEDTVVRDYIMKMKQLTEGGESKDSWLVKHQQRNVSCSLAMV